MSSAFSSSSSPSYINCSGGEDKLEGLISDLECSTMHVRTPRTFPSQVPQDLGLLLPYLLQSSSGYLQIPLRSHESLGLTVIELDIMFHSPVYIVQMFRFPILFRFPGIYSTVHTILQCQLMSTSSLSYSHYRHFAHHTG